MKHESIAVLSDIHGNRWALEAVLEDVAKRGIGTILNLGDSFYGPLDPAGTAELLMIVNAVGVRGNEDRIVAEGTEPSPTTAYVREQLSDEQIDYLRSLPFARSLGGEMFLFHGTPDDDSEYLIHEVSVDGLRRRGESAVQKLLEGRPETLFLCGHDHLPNVIQLADGKLVVDPGSVGLPAYSDDIPFEHFVESGNPTAKYCVVEKAPSKWVVEQIGIPYDHDAASKVAKHNHRDDWAFWLKTGRAR